MLFHYVCIVVTWYLMYNRFIVLCHIKCTFIKYAYDNLQMSKAFGYSLEYMYPHVPSPNK